MLYIRFILALFMIIGVTHAGDENYVPSAHKNPYSVLPIEGESKLHHKKRKKHKAQQQEDGHRQFSPVSDSFELNLSHREDEAYQSDGASMVDDSSSSVGDDSSDEVFENMSQRSDEPDDAESESASANACVAPPISEARVYFVSRLMDFVQATAEKTYEKLYDPVFQQKIVNQLMKRYVQMVGMVCSRFGYIDQSSYEEIWYQYNIGELLNNQAPAGVYK